MNKPSAIRIVTSDKIYYTFSGIFMTFLLLIVAYPIIYVISASFSSGLAVSSGRVVLWPVDFSVEGYAAVFRNRDILQAYTNTILYTVLGTFVNVAMVMTCAFPLSRPNLKGRNLIMFLLAFTMYFNGGLIPFYILMRDLKMIDTIWVMVIPGALSVYNMIIARTFIQSNIPNEMYEAASIDGCSNARYFFLIVLPLSKAVIAVVALFSAVAHWNSYFNAMLFLSKPELFPLQILLREILVLNSFDASMLIDPELQIERANIGDVLKYSFIVVASVPILLFYPFVQKYFIKGVMIGSIKG